MATIILWLWLVPMLAIGLMLLIDRPRWAEFLNLGVATNSLVTSAALIWTAPPHAVVLGDHSLLLTPLGLWVVLCVAIVYFLASLYAIGYMRLITDQAERLPRFYALMCGFALTMLVAPFMNNPGIYWIVIDLTTIVSAFLVGFEREAESAEAAWKYIIIVSAGLSLALLGIIFFYWAGTLRLGPVYDMTWRHLRLISASAPKAILLLAFLLTLVGFGTKVGLAPMHTWLPDAHSEGPAPVSALLSGALLNTAMLGVVRFLGILNAGGLGIAGRTALVVLGSLSLLVAALFIVRQTGTKRLMAYSSIEHMGIVALGFGFGGVLGIAGAMYHMLNHSLNKSLMFFGSGNMMRAYRSKDMRVIRRILRFYPVTGIAWLLGAIAITGAPPFGLFQSELAILRAGMAGPNVWAVWLMVILLIVIFIAFLQHFRRMYAGAAPNHAHMPHLRLSLWMTVPMWLALIPLTVLGLWWPPLLWHFFEQAARVAQ
ncbi:MAG: proton-conducting transporter transmembrane domain-containing protein [Acidiferrobacter sp.]